MLFGVERDLSQTDFFEYEFHYGLGTKFKNVFSTLNRCVTTDLPIVRDAFVEELLLRRQSRWSLTFFLTKRE
jgi:hypothetical protein